MWFLYALTFAFVSSLSVIIAKKVMKNMGEIDFLLYSSLFILPFLFLISSLFFERPQLNQKFWIATVVGTVISLTAAILAYRAIKNSEISLISPISAFNPIFTTLVSAVTLNEIIKPKTGLGILVIVLGAYLLQISKTSQGLFFPIRALVSHKGVQLSFAAYLLWSITPTFEKTAILNTFPQNPPFAAMMGQIIAIVIYSLFVIKKKGNPLKAIKTNWKLLIISGLLGGIGITAAFKAYTLNSLGPVTAVFKLSMIITVFFGWLFFKEKDIKERLLGSFTMLAGVILLVT
jgi:uncharacterized membrane protein